MTGRSEEPIGGFEVYDTCSQNFIFFGTEAEAIRFCEEGVNDPSGLCVWEVLPNGDYGRKVKEYHGPLVAP